MGRMLQARLTLKGTRTLLQNLFGPDAIPLDQDVKRQRKTEGVAGNNPKEWKRSCRVTEDGTLCFPGSYVAGWLRRGAAHVKDKHRSLKSDVEACLEPVIDDVLITNRVWKPGTEPPHFCTLNPPDPRTKVFVFVTGVVVGKAHHVRYRLAAQKGWECSFEIEWDGSLIGAGQMEAVAIDAGRYECFGDGRRLGCGRCEVEFELLTPEVNENGETEEVDEEVEEDEENNDELEEGEENGEPEADEEPVAKNAPASMGARPVPVRPVSLPPRPRPMPHRPPHS